MIYRKRQRSKRDPETGLTYALQRRKVAEEYLCMLGDDKPRGAFDLGYWAEENDQTCDPRSGGLANVASMAAAGGLSRRTLVNSVFPQIEHCLHYAGPVVISTTNTIVPACRDYADEQRSKQRAGGLRNVHNLNRWIPRTDVSSGSSFVR